VNVVWHDHKFILAQANFTAEVIGTHPFIVSDLPQGGILHLAVHDSSKDILTMICDERDEIRARSSVIVTFEAHGTAVVQSGIVWGHLLFLFEA
jgi:hypothetical protein